MRILLNTEDQSWGTDGAWFLTRGQAAEAAKNLPWSVDLETLREIETETATEADLADVVRTVKALPGPGAEAVLNAVALRKVVAWTGGTTPPPEWDHPLRGPNPPDDVVEIFTGRARFDAWATVREGRA